MKEKKIIQYVNFIYEGEDVKGLFGRSKCFRVIEDQRFGMNGLTVVRVGKSEISLKAKYIKKLEKILRDYDLSETVVTADNKMANALDISEMLFEARKYELIRNCPLIMKAVEQRINTMETAVVVIGSNRWNMKDLFSILSVVKNHFRKIDVVMEYQISNITSLVEAAYDEWGVVLHAYTLKSYHRDKVDFALLLLKKWKGGQQMRIPFGVAYMVTDEGIDDSMKQINKDMTCNIFCGLVYKAGNELLHSLGTQIAWQKPVLYEKFHVSVIDICELR